MGMRADDKRLNKLNILYKSVPTHERRQAINASIKYKFYISVPTSKRRHLAVKIAYYVTRGVKS